MGDTTEANKKVLSGELFLGVELLQTPIQKNQYMRDKVPFPRYCHICIPSKHKNNFLEFRNAMIEIKLTRVFLNLSASRSQRYPICFS